MKTTETTKKKHKVKKIVAIIFLCIIVIIAGLMTFFCNYHSNPENIKTYNTSNQYILKETDISGHRSGGGIEPEESLKAFKNCAENPNFNVDVFEFDLHLTKDNVLVLLHDDTLERTTDCETVLGEKDARPENYTYEELRALNIGAKFETEDKETPYAHLSGEQVPDDLKILRVEDALDYLLSVNNNYKFIIEIKNSGEMGTKGVDILHQILVDKNIIDQVIFGTFHKEVSAYVDENYPDMSRSTSIPEVLEFWKAALTNDPDYEPPCSVLQIPYCFPYKNLGLNIATSTVINYAHEHDMAVQFWTVNNEKDMKYLLDIHADCIMTDFPDKLYKISEENK